MPGAKYLATDAISPHPTGGAGTTVHIDDIAFISRHTLQTDFLCLPTFTYSRNDTDNSDIIPEEGDESALYSLAVHTNTNSQCVTWDKIRTATLGDDDIHQLVETIQQTHFPPTIDSNNLEKRILQN